MLNFDRLKTPPGDGDLLIEPAVSLWSQLIEQASRLPKADPTTLADVSLAEARQATRLALFGDRADIPVIACGHQPAFVHPGVWAKDIAVRQTAERLGIHGVHLVADNDALHTSNIQVPVIGQDTLLKLGQVALGPEPTGAAYEGQPACEKSEIANTRKHFKQMLAERFDDSCIGAFLDGMNNDHNATDFVQQYLSSRAQLDGSLSADLPQIRISQAFGGPFVADILLNADRFASDYNDALAEYRDRYGVRSAQRPLPDLGKVGDRIETALWIYKPLEPRQRLWVGQREDAIDLYADKTHVATLSQDELRRDPGAIRSTIRPWVIRPRALTLTLWARLLVCDLFVHGIGGAKYDRITDGILRRYYRFEPACYACVSATLRLALPRQSATADKVADAMHKARDLYFNPDRYLRNAPAELLAERSSLIAESARLRDTRASSYVRRHNFHAIRQVNMRLLESNPQIERQLTEQIDCLRHQLDSNRIADGREYFYALQPRERLAELVERIISCCKVK